MNKIRSIIAAFAAAGAIGSSAVAGADVGPVLDENSFGSFLVFPKFDIRGETSTQLRIVNNGEYSGSVKLNYVCPGIKHVNEFCAALDRTVTLTPHETRIINVADHNPPCNQGYVVAFALNQGNPVSYNELSGSWAISSNRRHEADNALAFQSVQSTGSTLGTTQFGVRQLRFGGGDYNGLPTKLYTDFRAVTGGEPDEGSRVTLLTLDVLAGMQNPPAVAFVDFWNSAEEPFSSSVEFICWAEYQLDDIDVNFLEENLGTTYGSMKINPHPNCPIPGTCPPLQPYDAAMLGSIQEYGDGTFAGRTMYHDQSPTQAVYQPR